MLPSDTYTETLPFGNLLGWYFENIFNRTITVSGKRSYFFRKHFYHGNKEIHLLRCNLKIFGAFITLMDQVFESCYHGNRDTFVTLPFGDNGPLRKFIICDCRILLHNLLQ